MWTQSIFLKIPIIWTTLWITKSDEFFGDLTPFSGVNVIASGSMFVCLLKENGNNQFILFLLKDVPLENPNPDDGYIYYEQLKTSYGTFKIGKTFQWHVGFLQERL